MKQQYPTNNPADHPDIARLRKLAHRMDNAFRIPLIGTRVGWDSILGLVPVVGDVLALAPAIYILSESRRLGIGPAALARMAANLGLDLAIGSIPVVGDVFDIGWKANVRNVEILHAYVLRSAETQKGDPKAAPVMRS